MPRFHLHLHNRIGVSQDEEGEEFPHLAAARERAIASIRDILAEEVKGGVVDLRGRVEIADPHQEVLAVVPFADAVELHLEEGRR
jgi:hypothetical protein